MIQSLAHTVELRVHNVLSDFTTSRFWILKTSIACFLIVIFFSCPYYEHFLSRSENDTWGTVIKQIDSPFTQYNLENPESHNAKRTFRLFVPILAKTLGIRNIFIIYSMQLLVAIAFFYLVIKVALRITNDKVSAILVATCFCFIYSGQVGIVDTLAKFDGIAIALLLAACYSRNLFIIFLCCFASAWTDERGLIAAPLVYLWWKISEAPKESLGSKPFALFWPHAKGWMVILSAIAYLALRFWLQQRFGLQAVKSGTGIAVLMQQLNMIPFGFWSAFEGLWLVILIAVLILLHRKNYGFALILCLASLPSFAVSFLVLDITRSIIYTLPLFFIALYIISSTENPLVLRRLLFFSLLICALVPTYFAEGGFRIEGSNPLILKAVDGMKDLLLSR